MSTFELIEGFSKTNIDVILFNKGWKLMMIIKNHKNYFESDLV